MKDQRTRLFPDSEPVFASVTLEGITELSELEEELRALRYLRIRAVGKAFSHIDDSFSRKNAQTVKDFLQAAILADCLYRRIVSAEKRKQE